jgi:hypothetical protein
MFDRNSFHCVEISCRVPDCWPGEEDGRVSRRRPVSPPTEQKLVAVLSLRSCEATMAERLKLGTDQPTCGASNVTVTIATGKQTKNIANVYPMTSRAWSPRIASVGSIQNGCSRFALASPRS